MSSHEYHFITHWHVPGTIEEVAEILADAPDLARWWPSVYLDVQETKPGDKDGIGKEVSLYTTGWLPYTLRWQFRVTESNYPHSFALEAWGDFVGRGEWLLRQDGRWVEVIYDWRLRAEKPLLRHLSFLMRPVFEANHRWAMARGEESLRLELVRRAAGKNERPGGHARGKPLPAPPGPTNQRTFLWLTALALVIIFAVGVGLRRRLLKSARRK